MIVVDDVEFEVNAIPHVVEVGDVSAKNVDDDAFEVVVPERGVLSTASSVTKVSKLLVLTKQCMYIIATTCVCTVRFTIQCPINCIVDAWN
jgi:hypothetical protein